MDPATRLQLLRDEYLKLTDIVESFDQRALQIKGWSVTLSLAGMLAAFTQAGAQGSRPVIIVLAITSAMCFWVMEYFWKTYQWTMGERVAAIEEALRSDDPAIAPFQIQAQFKTSIGRVMLQRLPHVFSPSLFLPHLIIVVLGFVLLP